MKILLGLLLMYGPWALFAAIFWSVVAWWNRRLTSYDVMARFRPSRADVLRAERDLKVS